MLNYLNKHLTYEIDPNSDIKRSRLRVHIYVGSSEVKSQSISKTFLQRFLPSAMASVFHSFEIVESETVGNDGEILFQIEANSCSCENCENTFGQGSAGSISTNEDAGKFTVVTIDEWKRQVEMKQRMKLEHRTVKDSPDENKTSTKPEKVWLHCSECVKKFTSKVRLQNHIESTHINKRSYSCKFCNSVFKFKQRLWKHSIKYHAKEDFSENFKDEMKSSQPELQGTTTKITESSIFHNIESDSKISHLN